MSKKQTFRSEDNTFCLLGDDNHQSVV